MAGDDFAERAVATHVAKDLLHDRELPAELHGLTLHVVDPCSACTHVWQVAAVAPRGRTVDFDVFAA
jgi:hypothetical protein